MDSAASSIIATDVTWLRKALKRAKEQAVAENKSLEEIAAIRWGSLEKFYSLLDEAEKKCGNKYSPPQDIMLHQNYRNRSRSRERKRNRSKSRERNRSRERKRNSSKSRERNRSKEPERKRSSSSERGKRSNNYNKDDDKKFAKVKMLCPNSDDEDSSFHSSKSQIKTRNSSSQKSWKKIKVNEEHLDTTPDCTYTSIPSPVSQVKEYYPPQKENAAVEIKESIPVNVLTDQELNKLAAKLTKAELMGNDSLAQKLKKKLEESRQARNSSTVSSESAQRIEKEVLLTKTLPSGYTVPVIQSESKPKKRNNKLTAFLEETRALKNMFEIEKGTSAEDQNEIAEAAALQMGATLEEDYDDVGGASDALHKQMGRLQDKQRERAIMEYHSNEKSLDSCSWCMVNKEMQRHLIVALGTKCYLALLPHEEINNGQCVISPIHHVQSSLMADEDLWQEIMDFRKALVSFYLSRGEDSVFFETYLKNKSHIPHMVIHCIPLPKEIGDLSPIYFKKAIDECEHEWSQNKKLVNLKGKGVRSCIPKGLSYFFVDFGTSPGYAHVIEDEKRFPRKFAEEIICGMLEVEAFRWLRPTKQQFDIQCKKVIQFSEEFKSFDPSKR